MTDTPTGGCSHATCLPLNGDGCQYDDATVTAPLTADYFLARRWTAVPNDEIGGWAVSPNGQGPLNGGPMVADMMWSEEIAEHIADLHNRHLADVAERGRGPLSAPTSAEHGSVAPEATPIPAETS